MGYLSDNGGISSPLINGFMPSGDIGFMKDERLKITGRLKDLIIRGGINVCPIQIEEVLQQELGVEQVAVVGVPHDVWGEIIVAFLVADEALINDLSVKLRQRCLAMLSEGTRPDKYIWLRDLPRSSNGKVQKSKLVNNF